MRLSITFTPEQQAGLEVAAKAEHRSLAFIVRRVVDEWRAPKHINSSGTWGLMPIPGREDDIEGELLVEGRRQQPAHASLVGLRAPPSPDTISAALWQGDGERDPVPLEVRAPLPTTAQGGGT